MAREPGSEDGVVVDHETNTIKLVLNDQSKVSVDLTSITFVSGSAIITVGLPESDPGVVGQLWASGNLLAVSAGP